MIILTNYQKGIGYGDIVFKNKTIGTWDWDSDANSYFAHFNAKPGDISFKDKDDLEKMLYSSSIKDELLNPLSENKMIKVKKILEQLERLVEAPQAKKQKK